MTGQAVGILIIMPTFAGWLVAVAAMALPVLRLREDERHE